VPKYWVNNIATVRSIILSCMMQVRGKHPRRPIQETCFGNNNHHEQIRCIFTWSCHHVITNKAGLPMTEQWTGPKIVTEKLLPRSFDLLCNRRSLLLLNSRKSKYPTALAYLSFSERFCPKLNWIMIRKYDYLGRKFHDLNFLTDQITATASLQWRNRYSIIMSSCWY